MFLISPNKEKIVPTHIGLESLLEISPKGNEQLFKHIPISCTNSNMNNNICDINDWKNSRQFVCKIVEN